MLDPLDAENPSQVNLTMPKDIGYPLYSTEQWCNIGIFEYVFRAETNKQLKNSLGNIRLPLPLQLQTQYQQEWNNMDNLVSLAIGSVKSDGDLVEVLKNVALSPEGAGAIGAGIGAVVGGGKIGGILGLAASSGVIQGASSFLGYSANKFETVSYQKPQLRQHQFNWRLVARSRKEGEAIQNIIKKLKFHSHPEAVGGTYFKYPELFVLKFQSDRNLFTIAPSIMENFSVDYHAAGRPLYHATDKMPINVSISCSFRETVAITKKTILEEGR